LPAAGIETAPGNVELPLAYHVVVDDQSERVPAERMLHTKIGVDANVKRGVSIFLPVIDALKRFQGWLDTELIHRKMAASIVWVRKHENSHPAAVVAAADAAATGTSTIAGETLRRLKIRPGSIIDAQGFDLQSLSPNTHFDDAAILGRMILLSIAAGTGLPEFMLSADASNANYASTLVAEGPAVRHFAAWQTFFTGQWRKLFRLVVNEAVRLRLLRPGEARSVTLQITPPTLAVRNRHQEALADSIYYRHGALSSRELSRRDNADPEQMQRERAHERAARGK
jgi:capsid protein